jgi:hypothetical protein
VINQLLVRGIVEVALKEMDGIHVVVLVKYLVVQVR